MQADIEDLDIDAFTDGMRDVFDGNELAMNEEEMMEALSAREFNGGGERKSCRAGADES